MEKEKIIKIVDEVKSSLDTSVFAEEERKGSIGCNQFRELSSICRRAECYEEVEMLVKYNEAKAEVRNNEGQSWRKKMKNGRTLAACIIDGMQRIKNESGEDCLKDLCLYFGYLYWTARIFAADNKENQSSGQNDHNFKGSNQRTGRNFNNKNVYNGRR
ncbi:MAG: hypothetical protein J6Y93_00555 [Treponema sp.]|nr:hypothetical protein [Treponema sp.]